MVRVGVVATRPTAVQQLRRVELERTLPNVVAGLAGGGAVDRHRYSGVPRLHEWETVQDRGGLVAEDRGSVGDESVGPHPGDGSIARTERRPHLGRQVDTPPHPDQPSSLHVSAVAADVVARLARVAGDDESINEVRGLQWHRVNLSDATRPWRRVGTSAQNDPKSPPVDARPSSPASRLRACAPRVPADKTRWYQGAFCPHCRVRRVPVRARRVGRACVGYADRSDGRLSLRPYRAASCGFCSP